MITVPNDRFTYPFTNMPFLSYPGTLYQNEVKCSTFDMKINFHSRANETHFHKKGCALGLILKVMVFGTGQLTNGTPFTYLV